MDDKTSIVKKLDLLVPRPFHGPLCQVFREGVGKVSKEQGAPTLNEGQQLVDLLLGHVGIVHAVDINKPALSKP